MHLEQAAMESFIFILFYHENVYKILVELKINKLCTVLQSYVPVTLQRVRRRVKNILSMLKTSQRVTHMFLHATQTFVHVIHTIHTLEE